MLTRFGVPVAGLLSVALLGLPSGAAAEPDPAPQLAADLARTQTESPRERAEDALARAEALSRRTSPAAARRTLAAGGAEATMALNQVLRTREDLAPTDQRRATRLLARPTAPGGDGYAEYTVAEATPVCGTAVCVHYVTTTADAPPLVSNDTDPIPDAVQEALATAEHVHQTYTGAGYRRPDPDGALGTGSDMVDVYLADVGSIGFYGYCASDQPAKSDDSFNYWAYCVIDDDFADSQFGTNTPTENQQVTLAHEYFHAVQYAYDAGEDPWFMEASATWAEDELYDDVDDNRQYLPEGQLQLPYAPLDYWENGASYQYGNWIFLRYLTERWPVETGGLPTIVRQLIERTSARSGQRDDYSTQALQWALSERRTSFTEVYSQFATANRTPQRSYSEGRFYQAAPPSKTWRLTSRRRSTGTSRITPWHLSNHPLRYKPGRGTTARKWKIRLQVDLPAKITAPVARVLVVKKTGGVSASTIRVNRKGKGTAVLPFSSRSVRYVELVLVNASRRTACWSDVNDDYAFACLGTPRDSLRPSDFAASIFRR